VDRLPAVSTEDRGAVLISGSSTGIGRACALRLDRAGFRVFAGVRNRGDAESLDAEGSERLEPVILDVTDEGTIDATRERIERRRIPHACRCFERVILQLPEFGHFVRVDADHAA